MKNIIVGVDFSNSAMNAMRHAVAVALKTGADLHLVWVKTPGVSNNVTEDQGDNYMSKVQNSLDEWQRLCQMESPDTNVNTVVLEGKVHQEITKYAANQPNSIIVMGTHGTSGFEEGYIGNNVYRLINNSTVPVLIMRENIEINRDLHNIYAPIDLSFETLQKMRYAIYLAKSFAAKISIVGVYYPNNADTRHVINVQMRHAADMCEDSNVRFDLVPLTIQNNLCQGLLNHAADLDSNLIVVMREENETDFTANATMREILSTSKMPLLIVPNVTAIGLGR
ncbi:MAG: universal stress protein [Bacteroidales bacterium]|nr:universal stress protein [Bacteroidales bacterium]MDY6347145.1 universal stress protein [Bacteroidales bacterium]